MYLSFQNSTDPPLDCSVLILVPEKALAEAGHIRCLAESQTGQSKHEFHALGQMALIQHEDGELPVRQVAGTLVIDTDDETIELAEGLAICRRRSGALAIVSNAGRSARKYLEAANRFCTRWVRLDI